MREVDHHRVRGQIAHDRLHHPDVLVGEAEIAEERDGVVAPAHEQSRYLREKT